ncbi:MAG: ferrous iron transport protein B, partial [Acutalibacteraceae bacterium]
MEQQPPRRTVALAGNPNVGKSTIFNALTGLKQHTGNWTGKTVELAKGDIVHQDTPYTLVDIPGTYSLLAHSAEEEVARDFICFGKADAVVVVCDATCLERNLNLVLQTMEMTDHVGICINLMDEAKKKHIDIDCARLSARLGVPVVATTARSRKGLRALLNMIEQLTLYSNRQAVVRYTDAIEAAAAQIEGVLKPLLYDRLNSRFVALRLLEQDDDILKAIRDFLGDSTLDSPALCQTVDDALCALEESGLSRENIQKALVSGLILRAEEICLDTVSGCDAGCFERDRKIDRLLTGKATGFPVMLLMLCLIFWITISAANVPSSWLSDGFAWLEPHLLGGLHFLCAPEWLCSVLIDGVYRVLSWVISVMLPPMAIFFPLFTLLEDLGYLPRVAFNLDNYFQKACTCGKQSLSMCMGFGCNAVGVTGCRIIDSPRERLIAILTNVFVPCNGRFPTILSLITLFFVGTAAGALSSLFSALALTAVIVFSIAVSLFCSKLLSYTLLKGTPSSFTLELPPYRRPQIEKILTRSLLDRTLVVLGRAVSVAAPAGLVIWLMANVTVGNASLLSHLSAFL